MELVEEQELTNGVTEIKKAIENASTDDGPIAITTDHGKHVNGDTTKAMTLGKDVYSVEFWYPLDDERYQDMPIVSGKPYRKVVKRFKSDGISANDILKLQSCSTIIVQTVTKFIEDGTIKFPNDDELIKFVISIGTDQFEDACWKLASIVLGIDDSEKSNIYTINLLLTVAQIINNNLAFFQID